MGTYEDTGLEKSRTLADSKDPFGEKRLQATEAAMEEALRAAGAAREAATQNASEDAPEALLRQLLAKRRLAAVAAVRPPSGGAPSSGERAGSAADTLEALQQLAAEAPEAALEEGEDGGERRQLAAVDGRFAHMQ